MMDEMIQNHVKIVELLNKEIKFNLDILTTRLINRNVILKKGKYAGQKAVVKYCFANKNGTYVRTNIYQLDGDGFIDDYFYEVYNIKDVEFKCL